MQQKMKGRVFYFRLWDVFAVICVSFPERKKHQHAFPWMKKQDGSFVGWMISFHEKLQRCVSLLFSFRKNPFLAPLSSSATPGISTMAEKRAASSPFLLGKHIFKRSFSFSASAILSFSEGSVFFHSEDLLESTFGSSFLILSKGSVTNKSAKFQGVRLEAPHNNFGSAFQGQIGNPPKKIPSKKLWPEMGLTISLNKRRDTLWDARKGRQKRKEKKPSGKVQWLVGKYAPFWRCMTHRFFTRGWIPGSPLLVLPGGKHSFSFFKHKNESMNSKGDL